ncbi:MBL fold metallo-hydrolase [Arenicella xantha]|uniref:Glyoxylase-like metal-dependent hydrolase (Beta-lactamase superfamily II) n=1 Tax=Arenicella xantha TaxID=644221 RepID=A0A395JNK3_9GAMM|nr:MBL fold metallo-hydrolase [Arenicella xantha]RBP53067.1 glyoxylase-like metal-dependent hydrolase (beta-lactamase superfamily II) [Arenicella xantha]
MTFLKRAAGLIVLLIAVFVCYVIWNVRSFEVEQLSEDLYVIRGIGGNTTVLKTDQGTVVIDSMTFPMQGKLIRKQAEELTGREVALLINTHYHLDHTHGNPGFEPGTAVVSTERTLSHLKALDADFWDGDAALLLPNDTFSDRKQFDLGNKTISVIHPGRGHTDGDLVVLLEQENTMVMGDLFFNKHYPNIDLEAGGSVQAWPTTIENVLPENFERVIPGHGDTTDRLGLLGYQRFMSQLAMLGELAANNDTSLDDMVADQALTADAGYTAIKFAGIPIGLDRKFVLRRAWEEATGNVTLRNPPASK